MTVDRTYGMEPNPPSPMAWQEYTRVLSDEWARLLNSDPAPEERVIQAFLERHPCLAPGAFSMAINSGHCPLYASLITQPVLPDYRYRRPDFMWLATSSMALYPVLIEIESAAKKWFNKSGDRTADLNQAVDQLVNWRTWFDNSINVQRFREFYGIENTRADGRKFHPAYVLIYGRRAEATANPDFARKRANMQGPDQFFMTYDRLVPDPNGDQLWCIKGDPGKWQAVSIPATTQLSPMFAKDRAQILGRQEAITSNPMISSVRAEFLIRRLAYWDEWVRRGAEGPISAAACE